MTMPDERSRAVVQPRGFLVELCQVDSLPDRVRRNAKFLLLHTTRDDVALAGRIEEDRGTLPFGALGPVFSSTITR